MTDYRTPISRVRGHGSAHSGTEHFWQTRMTAIALTFLMPFFLVTFAIALGKPWEEVVSIYKSPFNAIVAALFLLVTFRHLSLGLQVVIEDYVSDVAWRTGSIIAVKLLCTLLGFAAAFSVAMIAFSV